MANYDVSATVDVGKNTKELLENGGEGVINLIKVLADKVGVAGNQLFPYYVKQAVVFGWGRLAITSIFIIICTVFGFVFMKKSDLYNANDRGNTRDACITAAFVCFIVAGVAGIAGVFNLPSWIAMIQNPEYTAIRTLVVDATELAKSVKP